MVHKVILTQQNLKKHTAWAVPSKRQLKVYIPKIQGSLGNVGIMGFVLTNFQTDNYGTSSGDDEG